MNENSLIEREAVQGEALQDYGHLIQEPGTEAFCSLVPTTMEEKKVLYKAITNSDGKLSDALNMPLNVSDIYCETVEVTDETNGLITKCPRIVLITEEGKSYQCVSFGVYNSLRRMISIFGTPTWNPSLTIIPKAIKKDKNQVYILTL